MIISYFAELLQMIHEFVPSFFRPLHLQTPLTKSAVFPIQSTLYVREYENYPGKNERRTSIDFVEYSNEE